MSDFKPDSATNNYETIDVFETPQSDNPKFGSVTVRLERGRSAQVVRMTQFDAESLAIKLSEYLNNETSN